MRAKPLNSNEDNFLTSIGISPDDGSSLQEGEPLRDGQPYNPNAPADQDTITMAGQPLAAPPI